MERISTHSSYQQLIQYGSQLQRSVFQQQQKLATSMKSADYDDVSSDSRLIQSSQSLLLRTEGYSRSAQLKLTESETKHARLQKISDLLIRAKTLASDALGAATDASKFKTVNKIAENLLMDLESLLNSKHDGNFLFAGSATDQRPVSIKHSTFTAQKAPSSADFKYYQGNTKSNFITVNSERVIEDNVRADNPAIEKAIRAVAMLTKVSSKERSTAQEAFRLIGEGISGVTGLMTNTGNINKSIKEALEGNKALKFQTEAILTSLTKTDSARVMADLASLQVLLQASYSSIAKNSQLNLLNFLK